MYGPHNTIGYGFPTSKIKSAGGGYNSNNNTFVDDSHVPPAPRERIYSEEKKYSSMNLDAASLGLRVYILKCREYGVTPNSAICTQYRDSTLQEKVVDLKDLYLGRRGIFPLIDVWAATHDLTLLILRGIGLRDEALSRLINMIRGHKHIETVDISNNPFSASFGRDLIVLLNVHPTLNAVIANDTHLDEVTRMTLQHYSTVLPEGTVFICFS